MSTEGPVPPLLTGLIDDAAVFPPGNAALADALAAHEGHRNAWYDALVGPLLLPNSTVHTLSVRQPPQIGVILDTGLDTADEAVTDAAAAPHCRQLEAPVAKRGEDPQPGLRRLLTAAAGGDGLPVYAELPLTTGLLGALDTIAADRAAGGHVAPKFRTGGLAAELFPSPTELAEVITACHARGLPYKLTAGLHHALRHADPETGFTHHGFLNVLAADLVAADVVAADGSGSAEVAEMLAVTDPRPLVAVTEPRLTHARPRWLGFGTCSVDEPLTDLRTLGLLPGDETRTREDARAGGEARPGGETQAKEGTVP